MENFRAFRGLSGTYNVRANEGVSDPAQNIECIVHFLNDTQQKFIIDRRCKGQTLLDSVFKHLNLIETDFFGLKFTPTELNGSPKATSQNSKGLEINATKSITPSPSPPPPISQPLTLPLINSPASSSPGNSTARRLDQESPNSRNPLRESTTNNTNVTNGSSHVKTTANHRSSPQSISSSENKSSPNHVPVSSQDQIAYGDNSANSTLTSLDKVSLLPNHLAKCPSERWLDPTKGIKKQCKSGPPHHFYFRVKFYVSDPCKLADDTTRYHLYQQLKLDIHNNRLIVPTCSAILLASYILQSEVGDYRNDPEVEKDNVSKFRLLPIQRDDFNKKVIELHKQHKFLSPADAQHQFLEHAAKKLDCYGVEFHQAHDIQTSADVRVGVSSNGIIVSRDNLISSSVALDTKGSSQLYSWAKILKIMFKKKIFSIQLRRDDHQRNNIISSIGGTGGSVGTFIEFSLLTNQACKSFWEECVAQHSFFRLHQPKSQPKKFFSFLKFGSKFQYNGKTEYQTMEESKKRSFSHFSRSPSKRYARNTIPIGRSSSNSTDHEDNNSKSHCVEDAGNIDLDLGQESCKHQRLENNNNNNATSNANSNFINSKKFPRVEEAPRQASGSGYRPKSLTLKSLKYIDESKGVQSTFDHLRGLTSRDCDDLDGSQKNAETNSISKLQVGKQNDRSVRKGLKRCESLRLPSSIRGALLLTRKAGVSSTHQLARISESLKGKFLSAKSSDTTRHHKSSPYESNSFPEGDDEDDDDETAQNNLNDLDTSRNNNSETGSTIIKTIRLLPGSDGRYGFKIKKITIRFRNGSDEGGTKSKKFKRRSIIICDVSPMSPAATCDTRLYEGDEILSINGLPVEGLSESKIERMIKGTQLKQPPELILEIRTCFTSGSQSGDSESIRSQSVAGSSSGGRRPNSASSTRTETRSNGKPMTLAESIRVIKKGLESKKLIHDFEKLSRKKEDETLDESRLIENIDKNRYQDILPYDSTRVQLIDSMTGDYINASFVDMPVPSGHINRYIATQGPLSSTCDDFWQMVWEQNCSLIIMVTPLVEAGRIKCHKYWPNEKDEVRHGQILVRNLSEKSKTATIDRSLQLVDVKSGETRMATQIQYKAWPDHEVPEDCGDFLKLVNRVRKHRATHQDDPIVVHCSAGIGRTGVLILMETALCTMECGEPIFPTKILSEMRKQRAMLIQTNSQFQFVADAIAKVFDQKSYRKFRKLKKK